MRILALFPYLDLHKQIGGAMCQSLDIIEVLRSRGSKVDIAVYTISGRRPKHAPPCVDFVIKVSDEKDYSKEYDFLLVCHVCNTCGLSTPKKSHDDQLGNLYHIIKYSRLPFLTFVHDELERKRSNSHQVLPKDPNFRGFVFTDYTQYEKLIPQDSMYDLGIIYQGFDFNRDLSYLTKSKLRVILSNSRLISCYGAKELARISGLLRSHGFVQMSFGTIPVYHAASNCFLQEAWCFLGTYNRLDLPRMMSKTMFCWAYFWGKRGLYPPRIGAAAVEAASFGCVLILVEMNKPDYFVHMENCLTIDPRSDNWPEKLLSDMNIVACDTNLRLNIVAKAYRILHHFYSHEVYADNLVKFLEKNCHAKSA